MRDDANSPDEELLSLLVSPEARDDQPATTTAEPAAAPPRQDPISPPVPRAPGLERPAPEPSASFVTRSNPLAPDRDIDYARRVDGGYACPVSHGLIIDDDQDSSTARILTAPGTTVHAICDSTVEQRDTSRLVARGHDGRAYEYAGIEPLASVVPGTPLRLGDAVATSEEHPVDIAVRDTAGDPVEAYAFLLGLPDPAEPPVGRGPVVPDAPR
jgi:hypothetical protein